ncbi:MAG: hypothetical protein P8R42_14230 [Candidatus Binatia bacterium]|nr:hypothetical protein [Candidatus Binatia bacterium]
MTTTPLVSPGTPPATEPRENVVPSLRPFRPGFWFGGFNGVTWMISLGTPMVLLAQHLGASAFQVGLASSFVFLLLPIQIVATAALPSLGFKRQMVLAWLVRTVFLVIPLGLVWVEFDAPQPWMPALLVTSVFGFCVCRAFGTAAHLPWMAAILPLELRGKFFATDQAITSVVGVGTLLTCAALFASLSARTAFGIVYLAAAMGAVLAVWNLSRLPSAPAPAALPLRAMAGHALELCMSPGRFRHYLLLMLTGSFVTSSLVAFTVYYLKTVRGLPSSEILLFTAAQFGGQIFGTASIRHQIDHVPLRRFFQIAVAMVAVVDLFWLALLNGVDGLVPWLGVAYFIFGMGVAMTNVTHATYLPELSPEKDRPITIAVFTAALGLLAGLAPMLWGLALKNSGPVPGMNVDHFLLFFGVGITLSLSLLVLFSRLPDLRPSLGPGRT